MVRSHFALIRLVRTNENVLRLRAGDHGWVEALQGAGRAGHWAQRAVCNGAAK